MPRIEIDAVTPGRFDVKDRHIDSFRLLLTRELIGDAEAIEVRWRGRRFKLPVKPSTEVFLRDFVERFDRTFLPIAEVVLKK